MELVSSLHGTLRAALAPGFEMRWWRRLLDRGGTGADLDRPRAAALSRWLGLSRRAAGRLARELASMKPAALLSELDGSGIELDAWHARGYPARMRELADPPPVLFRTGALLPCDENAIGVVGGSTCAAGAAPYAMRMAESVAFDLSRAGITVVLGLITPTVERIAGAVADRGRVLGVVDSDLARYAAARREPDPRAADGHAVFVSERVPRAPPDVPGAVARLVAGLSAAVVVVGSGPGVQVAVDTALDTGRPVMAVPGPVDTRAGMVTLRLLQDGATPVGSAADVFAGLGWCERPADEPSRLEWRCIDALGSAGARADQVARRVGVSLEAAVAYLLALETRGSVVRTSGDRWVVA